MCKCLDGLAVCNPALERFAREHERQNAAVREQIDKIAAQIPDVSAFVKTLAPTCQRCGA